MKNVNARFIMPTVDFHADDYGISLNNSREILECLKKGKLNSISIIPNTNHYEECMELLRNEWNSLPASPLISVHLNFIDGKSLSDESLPLLHDSNKLMTTSWGKLFIASFIPGNRRKQLKQQLQEEIKAQIDAVTKSLPQDCPLRIDSHMHTHMIPVVAQALLEVIDNYQYPVTFIRIAQEPFGAFIKKISLYKTYSPINFIKNIILNILSPSLKRELKRRHIAYSMLWGLIMSGHMDKNRIEVLYLDILHCANKKNLDLEILFHPGQALPDELDSANCKDDVNSFYLSENRIVEKTAVLTWMQN